MFEKSLLALFVLALSLAASYAEAARPEIFPVPKKLTWLNRAVTLPAGKTAIVIGARATQPEEYAADAFRRTAAKRWNAAIPVVRENQDLKPYSALILLGQRSTCALADRLCREWKLTLSETVPGWDGYVIHCGKSGSREVALVGGSNPRGVIYGQDTLSQLLSAKGDGLLLEAAAIRDRPSIRWRGRPHAGMPSYFRPDTFDNFAFARINFVDLRQGSAIYGTYPTLKLDEKPIREIVRESHRRGIFVFATVNCAVPAKYHDDIIRMYEQFIGLGADGLWISIDDPGGDLRMGTSFDLIRRIVALGKKHGITGEKIAMTPGSESYKTILTDTNRKTAAIPGMENAMLFFTPLPSQEGLRDYRSLGFKNKPCWWHNWPRPRGGFTHIDNGSTRTDGSAAFMELPALSEGWHEPGWEELAGSGGVVQAVMPWGGSAWPDYMVPGIMGLWAWAPELEDWDAHRRRLLGCIYGPAMAHRALEMDNALVELKSHFRFMPDLPGRPTDNMNGSWPPRLKDLTGRDKAAKALEEFADAVERVARGPHTGAMLDEQTIRRTYLEPARATVRAARAVVDLQYPEYWWPAHEARVMMAARTGNTAQAEVWSHEARERVDAELSRIKAVLDEQKLGRFELYGDAWAERFPEPSRIPKAPKAPVLADGLKDSAWEQAVVLQPFLLANDNGEVEDQTEARVLYTDDALWIAFTCHESAMDRLVLNATERDGVVWEDDSTEVFINTNGLGRPYVQLIANASGVQFDGRQPETGAFEFDWTGGWQVSTSKEPGLWTAVYRIPFAVLGVTGGVKGRMWMMNLIRNDHASALSDELGPHWMNVSAWGSKPRGFNHDTRRFRAFVFD